MSDVVKRKGSVRRAFDTVSDYLDLEPKEESRLIEIMNEMGINTDNAKTYLNNWVEKGYIRRTKAKTMTGKEVRIYFLG